RRFRKKNRRVWLCRLVGLLVILPLGWLVVHAAGLSDSLGGIIVGGVAASSVAILLLGMGAWALLTSLARLQIQGGYEPLIQAVTEGEARCRQLTARCSVAGQEQVNEAPKPFPPHVPPL